MALCSGRSGQFICPDSDADSDKCYCCGIPGIQFCCDFSTYSQMAFDLGLLKNPTCTRENVKTVCYDYCCGFPNYEECCSRAELIFGPGYKGIIAAIVIGGLVVIMIIGLLIHCCVQRRKRNRRAASTNGSGERLNSKF